MNSNNYYYYSSVVGVIIMYFKQLFLQLCIKVFDVVNPHHVPSFIKKTNYSDLNTNFHFEVVINSFIRQSIILFPTRTKGR